MYERLIEKAVCKEVHLVPLTGKHLIRFEEVSETVHRTACKTDKHEELNHLQSTNYCNKSLQQFISILTGWTLLVVFPATDVRHRSSGILRTTQKLGLADVLCFRKERETRIAIRRRDVKEGYTIEWIVAAVSKVDVDTKVQELDFKLTSRQTGRKLVLGTLTAADCRTRNGTEETETWIVTVTDDSGGLHSILRVRAAL